MFTASKYEKELEEHLEELHTEEQTVVTKWMHMQSSRNYIPREQKMRGVRLI